MQIVYESDRGQEELDLRINHPDATVADLAVALAAQGSSGGLSFADQQVHADRRLTDIGLHEGAVVRAASEGRSDDGRVQSGWALHVIGGVDAGGSFALAEGTTRVGRAPTNEITISHPTVSQVHCEVQRSGERAALTDRGSTNGTFVDGQPLASGSTVVVEPGALIEIGAVHARIEPVRVDDRPLAVDPQRHAGSGGTIPFTRPPRYAAPTPPAPLTVPKPPEKGTKPTFSVASIVAPVVFAVVMVAVTKRPEFALFSLLSPVMAIGSWWETGRRNKRTFGADARRYQGEVAELRRLVQALRAEEVQRLRRTLPDLAEVARRATLPSVRLWDRRPTHVDFLQLSAGFGYPPWRPELADQPPVLPPEVTEVLGEADVLPLAPMTVNLNDGGVVGLIGERGSAVALARSLLCQVVVHHGPADLLIAAFCDPGRQADWDWVKWLPHTRDLGGPGGARWLSARQDECDELLGKLLGGGRDGATSLVVIDSEALIESTSSPARKVLRGDGGPVAGIVVASTEDRLPAVCDTVIELRGRHGKATLRRPQLGEVSQPFLVAGLAEESARTCARVLARYADPEVDLPGAGLPEAASLIPLLDLKVVDAEAICGRWAQGGTNPGLIAPMGRSEKGVFCLDLVRQGPHGLIAGMTGSGKSELLRTLVAGLAVHADSHHLNFVLVDYKGGAAFDVCAELPHTVGMVTDLDEQLGERALRCLEAELQYRERLLKAAAVDSLPAYLRSGPGSPLPRLVVVIDEFATLVKELPDFVASLVGIAQRGRSLGVHLVLATQRPAGVVNDNIRANTDLRVALKVADPTDSVDIIGCPDAATISKSRPGRAYFRFGLEDVVPVQTARSTTVSGATTALVEAAPFHFGPVQGTTPDPGLREGHPRPRTDLDKLVEAVRQASARAGLSPPRRPWPEPLPTTIELSALGSAGDPTTTPDTVTFALADDPDNQCQYPVGWDLASGNLVLYGISGSGTTEALACLAVAAARQWTPDELHLHALDFGAEDLDVLSTLPHTGSVVRSKERERQVRLVRYLRTEIDRRREGRGAGEDPRIVLLVANVAGFFSEFDDVAGMELVDQFSRVFAEGPDVGVHVAMTADRSGAVPGALATLAPNKWVFRLADVADCAMFGLRRTDIPAPASGRAVIASNAQVVQVAAPEPTLEAAVRAIAGRRQVVQHPPMSIGVLPAVVDLASLHAEVVADTGARPWVLPVGVSEQDLRPTALSLYEAEHILVAGPARSGKSTALWAMAEVIKTTRSDVAVLGIASGRSPLRHCPHLDEHASCISDLLSAMTSAIEAGPTVVLVDDADTLDDGEEVMAALFKRRDPTVHVVAAGRPDVLRTLYGHWTQSVRRSKSGLLLRPNLDLDGELLGCALPRRQRVAARPGRGYLVDNGEWQLVQFAQPSATVTA